MSITVLAPGILTTVQDGGRIGYSALGVGHAGAMDSVALRLANTLVGNKNNAAALEMTLRGSRLRFNCDSLIAITGAPIDAQCNGNPVPSWRPVLIPAGSELVLGGMLQGRYSYLGIAGGINSARVLGSRCTDVNAGIGLHGGRPLATGDSIPIEPAPREICRELRRTLDTRSDNDNKHIYATNWSLDPQPWMESNPQLSLRFIAGTHFPQLDNDSQRVFSKGEFRIVNASNRVGYRLEGERLALREPLELISEGAIPGTVQLPPGGDPIVLMAEAPTCGGYPRIAHIIEVDLARLAQRRPGDIVRFTETSLEDAQTRYLERERMLNRIEQTVVERLRA